MGKPEERPVENTDKEIWRRDKDDYYSPSIHVTKGGGIGIDVGGKVIVKTVEEWHKASAANERGPEEKLNLEPGSADMTLQDIYAMFYILVRQSQTVKPGSKMSFPLEAFKTLPKKPAIYFERKHGRLFAWIPEKPKDRKKPKSKLYLPTHKIITDN